MMFKSLTSEESKNSLFLAWLCRADLISKSFSPFPLKKRKY